MKWITRSVSVVLVALSLLASLVYTLSYFDNNDLMYGAAPVVWNGDKELYIDMPFIQAPLSLLVPLFVKTLFATENLYTSARLLSTLLLLGSIAVLAASFSKEVRLIHVAVFVSLALTNGFVISGAKEIGSYTLPMFFIALCVFVSTRNIELNAKAFWISLLVGLAASAKLNHIVLLPGVLLLLYSGGRIKFATIAYAALGLIIGASPILYFLIGDAQAFYYNNVTFHMMTSIVRGHDLHGSVFNILRGSIVFILLLSIPLSLLCFFIYTGAVSPLYRLKIISVLLLCYAMAITPKILFPQ